MVRRGLCCQVHEGHSEVAPSSIYPDFLLQTAWRNLSNCGTLCNMQTLVDLFNTFPSHGNQTAFIHRTGVRRRVMSYAEFHSFSLRMSGWLLSQGVLPGDRVLLWAPNSPWWAVSFWGCVACGAIVVPVDFLSGRERVATILRLTSARFLLQSRVKGEPLGDIGSAYMEELPCVLADRQAADKPVSPNPAAIAELIYTSGTTGAPKGVILTHANLIANLMQVNLHIPQVTNEYRFLSCLPLSHMFEQMGGFFTPLLNGSSIVYLRTLKPSALMAAFDEEDIYAMIVVPRLLQLLRNSVERELAAKGMESLFRGLAKVAEHLSAAGRRILFTPVSRKFGRNLQLFVSGGAALSPELFRFWEGMGFRVVEGYGLTECSPVLAANSFDKRVPGSVGLPLQGIEIRFDQGELLARGENLFPGYYENEEATKAAFTADGWFRTGDLGELDTDGFLHLKGRRKELIVTGAGINVYPDEIEELLNQLPGVHEACVVGFDRGEGEEVHAVLIPDGSGRPPAEIIQDANERLDELQRITGFFIWNDADFPKTTTMKVQKFLVRKRLQEGRGAIAGEIAADRLISILVQITGSRPEEVTESSFLVANLGLTSIARLELVNTLEQEFRIDLDDALIDQRTRVSDLRDMLARRERSSVRQRFRPWVNTGSIRGFRRFCDLLIHFPLLHAFVVLKVRGRENLDGLEAPVLFIANHMSYLDQPVIMKALYPSWRYNTATAVWAEFFFKNFRNVVQRAWKICAYEYGTVALNLFPLPQSQGFRSSLEYMGRLVDRGVNLLVFPEGERSMTGRLLPFQQGLGVMVKELDIPVVPVKIEGLERVFPRGAVWPKRGKVIVTFGRPHIFGLDTQAEIVEKSRQMFEEQ